MTLTKIAEVTATFECFSLQIAVDRYWGRPSEFLPRRLDHVALCVSVLPALSNSNW